MNGGKKPGKKAAKFTIHNPIVPIFLWMPNVVIGTQYTSASGGWEQPPRNQADMRSAASAGGVENIRVRRPPIIIPKAPNVTHQTDDVDVKGPELC